MVFWINVDVHTSMTSQMLNMIKVIAVGFFWTLISEFLNNKNV